MPGLLVDKDLLTWLTIHFFSAMERGVQLSCSVLYIRKRWGKVGNFCLRKNVESFAEYTERWERKVAGAEKARIAHCLTWPSCKGPCFVTTTHAGRGCIALYHTWKTWSVAFKTHAVEARDWNLEKPQARNRSIDVSIDRRVTGVHVFVVGPTAYHMAYHGAEVCWSHGPRFGAKHDGSGTWQVWRKNNLSRAPRWLLD